MSYKAKVLNGLAGGTGVANADANTLTLAGALATSGAFASTFTMTNTTSVTFPTSGTLATTSQIPSTPISLVNGGTNASLTASNGGILYSNASTFAVLSGTATAGKALLSGSSTTPVWSTPTYPSASGSAGTLLRSDGTNNVYTTSTYPDTNAVNTILYASSANVMSALATANSGVLATNGSGVPSISTTPTVTSITFGSGTALNTYVQNTFTPAIAFGGASVGVTYTARVGFYTIIGNQVFIQLYILLSSKGSSTGAATITGLPVATNSTTNFFQSLPGVFGAVSFGAASFQSYALLFPSESVLRVSGITGSTGSAAQFSDTNFGNTSSIQVSGSYFT